MAENNLTAPPPAPPAAPPSALAVASLLVGVAGVGIGLLALLRQRQSDATADDWLQDNYNQWRGDERAAARKRRAARRAKRRGETP